MNFFFDYISLNHENLRFILAHLAPKYSKFINITYKLPEIIQTKAKFSSNHRGIPTTV